MPGAAPEMLGAHLNTLHNLHYYQELMRERGVNVASGCLPLLLQMPLLFIMYSQLFSFLTMRWAIPMTGCRSPPTTCSANPTGASPSR